MTLEEVRELAKSYSTIPVYKEILSDVRTPMEVLRIFKGVSSHCFMLESVENQEQWGCYTFLGFDPLMEITCLNGEMVIRNDKITNKKVNHPRKVIKEILDEYKSPRIEGLPSFTGGLVGYFAYDYAKYSEPSLNLDANDEEEFKDVDLMLFDKAIAFDNVKQKIFIIVNIKRRNLEIEYQKALVEIDKIISLIKNGKPIPVSPGKMKSKLHSLFNKQEFCEMVEKAKGKRFLRNYR